MVDQSQHRPESAGIAGINDVLRAGYAAVETARRGLVAEQIAAMNMVADALVEEREPVADMGAFLFATAGERLQFRYDDHGSSQRLYAGIASEFGAGHIHDIFAEQSGAEALKGPDTVYAYTADALVAPGEQGFRYGSSAVRYSVESDGFYGDQPFTYTYIGRMTVTADAIKGYREADAAQLATADVEAEDLVVLEVRRGANELGPSSVTEERPVVFKRGVAQWRQEDHISHYGAEVLKAAAAEKRLFDVSQQRA